MQTETLLLKLTDETKHTIEQAKQLMTLDADTLAWKADSTTWNILECIAHLNLYGHFYLPEFQNKITASTTSPSTTFKSGLLGNYFAKSMLPKPNGQKMKTFKDKNPINTQLELTVIEEFIQQQTALIALLQLCSTVNLNQVSISISITKLLKLKLGDALQFYSNHIIRHMQQTKDIQQRLISNKYQ